MFPNSVNSSLDIQYLEGAKHLENYILWEWWKDLSYMKDFYVPLKQYIVLHENLWNNIIFNFKTFRYFDTVSVRSFLSSPSPWRDISTQFPRSFCRPPLNRYFDTVLVSSFLSSPSPLRDISTQFPRSFCRPSPSLYPSTTCHLFKQVFWTKLQCLWFKFPNSVNSSLDIQYLEGAKHLENYILWEWWKDLSDMKAFYVPMKHYPPFRS